MKRIISALIVIMIILSLTTISMAAEVSVSLKPEKEKVEPGAEIKVSLIVNNFTRTGTQKAIEAKVEYDNTKLEYKGISWSNGWTGSLSEDETGVVANKSSEVKESEVIAEITYLVKAEEGKAEIKASQILTSADGDEVEASDTKTEIEIVKEASVTEKTLSSIKITKDPTKTVYIEGEKFDKAGMEITAEYSDGTSKVITNYTCEPTETLKLTDKIITIKYTENGTTKTVEQKIKVQEDEAGENDDQSEKKLTSIEITKAPTKTEYKKDEKFDKTGMEVKAKYSDGSSKVITDYIYTPTEKLKVTDKVVTIKYTENGVTKTVEQKIKVQEKANGTGNPDNTVSDKEYPDTGIDMLIIPIVCIVMIGVVSYIRYRKYKNI